MQKELDLKETINLPKTHFSMKANLPQNEPKWLEKWEKEDLYGQIRAARKHAPIFTLHDGPPYANGRIHLGTALNKILKDFIVKSRTVAGFNAPADRFGLYVIDRYGNRELVYLDPAIGAMCPTLLRPEPRPCRWPWPGPSPRPVSRRGARRSSARRSRRSRSASRRGPRSSRR